jgi:integrase/recombinase XerD
MTPPAGLREAADAYLAMRRALGYKLVTHGRLLMDFVGYCERCQAPAVTTALAVAWARSPADADPYWWTRRLGVARIFARHLETFDPATEVPAGNLLRTRPRRNVPYVYTSEEISALLDATSMLRPHRRPRLCTATYHTLLALLAITGMRVGETCALDSEDVDLTTGEGPGPAVPVTSSRSATNCSDRVDGRTLTGAYRLSCAV